MIRQEAHKFGYVLESHHRQPFKLIEGPEYTPPFGVQISVVDGTILASDFIDALDLRTPERVHAIKVELKVTNVGKGEGWEHEIEPRKGCPTEGK